MRLTTKKINDISKNYNLGEAKTIKKLTKGYANINYKISTSKGNYVFKICKEKPLNEIKHELKVLNVLKKTKFPAAYPIQRIDKKYINFTKLGKIILYDYIEGKEPKVNKEIVKEIARAVAKLNSFKNWKSLKKKNSMNFDKCKKVIKRFNKSKYKYPEMFKYFKEETDFLSKILKQKIPRGLIHTDIFPANTLFKRNKLQAILDFEEVCTDNLLFDVAITINGFCFRKHKLDFELLRTFLREYNKIRKLSKNEEELLYYYLRWTAHINICWFLEHLLKKKEIKNLQRAESHMKRVKELRKINPSKILKNY